MISPSVVTTLARWLVRWRGWLIVAWAALAVLLAPAAARVHQVLAVRGGSRAATESRRAAEVIQRGFPSPIAEYVAIVVLQSAGPTLASTPCSIPSRRRWPGAPT
ncbi:MAG: hypothetical protein ACREMV_00470 [Gemmatimonadales bacterium]